MAAPGRFVCRASATTALLVAATAMPEERERLTLVVFMTDGLPSVGEQRPEHLAEMAAAQSGLTRTATKPAVKITAQKVTMNIMNILRNSLLGSNSIPNKRCV